MLASAKGKQQKLVRQLQCQEQSIDHIPYYLSVLSRAHVLRTTSLSHGLAYIEITIFTIATHRT